MEKNNYSSMSSSESSSSDPIAQHEKLAQQWEAEGFEVVSKNRHEKQSSDTSPVPTSVDSGSTLPISHDGEDQCLLKTKVAESANKQESIDKWVAAQAARRRGVKTQKGSSWLSSWWSPPEPEVPIQVPRIRPVTPPSAPPPSMTPPEASTTHHQPELNLMQSSMTSSSEDWSQVSVVEVKTPDEIAVEADMNTSVDKFSDDFAEQEPPMSLGSSENFSVDWTKIEPISATVVGQSLVVKVEEFDKIRINLENQTIQVMKPVASIDHSDDEDTDEIPEEIQVGEDTRIPIPSDDDDDDEIINVDYVEPQVQEDTRIPIPSDDDDDDEIINVDYVEPQVQPLMTAKQTRAVIETQAMPSMPALRQPLEEHDDQGESAQAGPAVEPVNVRTVRQRTYRPRRRRPDYVTVRIPRRLLPGLCFLIGFAIFTLGLCSLMMAEERSYRVYQI